MKQIVWIAMFAAMLLQACDIKNTKNTQIDYLIVGTWKDAEGKVVYLKKQIDDKNYEVTDSTVVQNELFVLKGQLNDVCKRTLFIEDNKSLLVVDTTTILVNCTTTKRRNRDCLNVDIEAGHNQEMLYQYLDMKKNEMFLMLGMALGADTLKATGNEGALDSLANALQRIKNENKVKFIKLIKDNNNWHASAMLMKDGMMNDFSIEEIEDCYNSLPETIQNSQFGQEVTQALNEKKALMPGQPAPEFVMKDQTGKTIKLTDFKGKYVLIDFWASWCGPCCKEIPNLKEIYAKHKNNGLAFISISLDHKEKAWLNALEKYDMEWPQVCDFKKYDGNVVKQYQISAIPKLFLIDPEGQIVSSKLRGEELAKKIDDLLSR